MILRYNLCDFHKMNGLCTNNRNSIERSIQKYCIDSKLQETLHKGVYSVEIDSLWQKILDEKSPIQEQIESQTDLNKICFRKKCTHCSI